MMFSSLGVSNAFYHLRYCKLMISLSGYNLTSKSRKTYTHVYTLLHKSGLVSSITIFSPHQPNCKLPKGKDDFFYF